MKILVIASYLPYPLFSGGQVRLYNLLKELSATHEITLICEKRPHQTKEHIQEMEKICKKVITVDRRPQWSIKNLFKSGFSSHSFLATGHTHPEMKQHIMDELVRIHYDVIHVETFYVIQNLPKTSIPIVLVEHNIEYLVYKRYIDRAPAPLRPLLSLDVTKIKWDEEKSWKKAAKVIAVSEEDKKVIEEKGFKPAIVPNGVNIKQFNVKDTKKAVVEKEKKILFIGDFTWIQNQDAITFIIESIWPKIDTEFSVKLWVVGRKIPDAIRNLTDDPDIIFDEKSSAKPTPEIFQEANVLLAPIRVGGGTSYKILESMSCGTPVVTMQMSADAILAKDGEELMIGHTAQELAEKTSILLRDRKLYEKVSKNGRELIEKKYSWKNIAKELELVYKVVVR